jgi:hypothetical protein
MEFKQWLEHAGAPGAKQTLYPMSYGGVGLYTPPDIATWAADSMTYMPLKDRKLKFNWGKGMLAKPDGLEIPENKKYEPPESDNGQANFVWGKGMLAKPKALEYTIKTLHTQERDGEGGVRFMWGKGLLAKPDGVNVRSI